MAARVRLPRVSLTGQRRALEPMKRFSLFAVFFALGCSGTDDAGSETGSPDAQDAQDAGPDDASQGEKAWTRDTGVAAPDDASTALDAAPLRPDDGGCLPNEIACRLGCTDPNIDPNNCGECGHVCTTGIASASSICEGGDSGVCAWRCYAGLVFCPGKSACLPPTAACPS